MKNMLDKLISIGGTALVSEFRPPETWDGLKGELCDLLLRKNGFYAFEAALLVRPFGESLTPISLDPWNKPDLWLDAYRLDLPELYFFAEDVFGGQFALSKDGVVSFDPETGKLERVSSSLEGWAEGLLDDYDYFTGYSLASAWQKEHGCLPMGSRLIPKQLFVLGGDFESSNLMCVKDVRGMRSRGFFATELKDVPDGGQVTFELVD
ncbi:hypothetical protein [Verrucomicrobium sp. BvORR034]|uniref:hypothetical protein n=1 Tax=Verrucomicrobium sp. BvORR034 TaxID=1396418 RepID=UPI0006794AF3|nr:hypothetical protein [Verrucomicrobium sp. BvORR034]